MPTPSVLERLRAAEAQRREREQALALPEALAEFATNMTGVRGPDYTQRRRAIGDETTGGLERELAAEAADREVAEREAAAAARRAPADDFDRAVFGGLLPEGVDLSSLPRERLYSALPTLGKLADQQRQARQQAETERHNRAIEQRPSGGSNESLLYRMLRDQQLDKRHATERGEDRELAQQRLHKTEDDKKRANVLKVEESVKNVKDRINEAKAILERSGTFELFGPDQQLLEGSMSAIATELAKLRDPESVAMPGEVAREAASLLRTGPTGNTKGTGKVLLEALERQIETRRQNAYQVRGMQPPAASSPPPGADTPLADPGPSIDELIAERNRRRGGQ